MKFAFRTDASLQIGTGHVMRCLTLANALRERGADCRFICREHPGNLLHLIREQGFEAVALPGESSERGYPPKAVQSDLAHAEWLGADWRTDAEAARAALGGVKVDWLVVDHYALDARWEAAMRPNCCKLLVIDDLADRIHDCDLLLDQNLVADMERRYDGKVPHHCGRLLGPQYALLQPEYAELHPRIPPREGPVSRVLIYFGGADRDNQTGRALAACLSLGRQDIALDVVINPNSPHADSIQAQAQGKGQVTLHSHLPSLAPLMVRADLAIGAGGATSWERCCLGLPTLVITIAENQKPIAEELHQQGLVQWLGHASEASEQSIANDLATIFDKDLPSAWSEKCQQFADGLGADRVCSVLLLSPETPLRARLARLDDEALILRWANDPLVRRNAFTTETIDPVTHRAWFRKRLRDLENCRLQIVETDDGFPLGQVRFDRDQEQWEVHYSMDSRCRGRGMGTSLLAAGLRSFRTTHPSDTIFGRVKPGNDASQKVFRALGFAEEATANELIYRQATG